MKNIKILVRFDCPDCHRQGKVARDKNKDPFELYGMSTTEKLYSSVYCPTCRGQKYLEEWVPIENVLFNKGD